MFIRARQNNVTQLHNNLGIKLLKRLRLGFSHLKEHKFKPSFYDSINHLRSYGANIESINHFFFLL